MHLEKKILWRGGCLHQKRKNFAFTAAKYSFEFKFRQWTTAPFNLPPEGSA